MTQPPAPPAAPPRPSLAGGGSGPSLAESGRGSPSGAAAPAAPAPTAARAATTARFVVVDASAEIRARVVALCRACATALSRTPEVHEASDGQTAEALILDHAPHIVVLEALLDRGGGFALLRKVRGFRLEHPPAWVFVTEMSSETDRYWAMRLGAHAYLRKPFEDDHLRARISKLLEEPPTTRDDRRRG